VKIKQFLTGTAGRQAVYLGVCVFCLGLWGVGCSTPRSTSPGEVFPLLRTSFSNERQAQKEIEEAKKLIDAGDTSTVIPRLQHTISKYHDSKAAIDARYWLGVAYYKIGDYPDAIDLFNEYLQKAPQGAYAKECSEIVEKAATEYQAKHPSPEKLDEMIKATEDQLRANPTLEGRMAIADLRWRRGDYTRAGAEYQAILREHPEYVNDPTVKARIEIDRNGGLVLLTPAEQQRRQIEAQPLAVINTRSFRSGEDLFTREKRYYAVSGQVVNRGDSVLYGIEVAVTIYGVGNIVFDTTSVGIRRLNPGETRAFSVKFTNFDNIENVNRYECIATFER